MELSHVFVICISMGIIGCQRPPAAGSGAAAAAPGKAGPSPAATPAASKIQGKPGDIRPFKSMIVKLHNDYRRSEGATKMKLLRWSRRLEREAYAHVNNCRYRHQYGSWGENLYKVESFLPNNVLIERALSTWYYEKLGWHWQPDCGEACHYTQMVWANSSEIGCAFKKCPILTLREEFINNGWMLVCFYNPQGNVIGEFPYAHGRPCSECDQRDYCDRGLCASPAPVYRPPPPTAPPPPRKRPPPPRRKPTPPTTAPRLKPEPPKPAARVHRPPPVVHSAKPRSRGSPAYSYKQRTPEKRGSKAAVFSIHKPHQQVFKANIPPVDKKHDVRPAAHAQRTQLQDPYGGPAHHPPHDPPTKTPPSTNTQSPPKSGPKEVPHSANEKAPRSKTPPAANNKILDIVANANGMFTTGELRASDKYPVSQTKDKVQGQYRDYHAGNARDKSAGGQKSFGVNLGSAGILSSFSQNPTKLSSGRHRDIRLAQPSTPAPTMPTPTTRRTVPPTAPPPPPKPAAKTCNDQDKHCSSWKVYCDTNPYVHENCRNTCNTCNVPTPPRMDFTTVAGNRYRNQATTSQAKKVTTKPPPQVTVTTTLYPPTYDPSKPPTKAPPPRRPRPRPRPRPQKPRNAQRTRRPQYQGPYQQPTQPYHRPTQPPSYHTTAYYRATTYAARAPTTTPPYPNYNAAGSGYPPNTGGGFGGQGIPSGVGGGPNFLCKDYDNRCKTWARYCGLDEYVDDMCRKTCNRCFA